MKITIDTKEDSHDEIKKVIKMLSNLVEMTPEGPKNIFESDDTPSDNVFGNMFGSADETPSVQAEETEEQKEVPKVIEY